MLYKKDEQSKIKFINLVNSFMLLDGNKTDEEQKLLANLEKYLLNVTNNTKYEYKNKEEIKKVFYEIDHEYRTYLKEILIEINDKNNYKEDGFFTKSTKGDWDKWLKSELK